MLRNKLVLNEAAWCRLFPKMQFATMGNRNARVAAGKHERLDERSRAPVWYYRESLRTLTSIQWRHLPSPGHLVEDHCRDSPSFECLVGLAVRFSGSPFLMAEGKTPSPLFKSYPPTRTPVGWTLPITTA
ncbi:unnamed protein product [Peniophora sp. CBMAI 1063]|nr:unnamed protein product [Peniophora sp. CBMAI 1063]